MAKECKNCAHESNFKKHECGTCMVSYFNGEQLGLPSNFKQKTMTNADRIRAMSDEELAEYFAEIGNDTSNGIAYSENQEEWLEWLKQPAEE